MNEWLIAISGAGFTLIVGLQSWILIKLIDHEKQLYRLVSDWESEKRTRAERNRTIDERLLHIERSLE